MVTAEGHLQASPLARATGEFGALFDVDGLSAIGNPKMWLKDGSPDPEERYLASWALDLNDLVLPTDPRVVRLVRGRTADQPQSRPFEVRVLFEVGAWFAVGIIRDNGGTLSRTERIHVPAGWNVFGIEWRRASGPGENDWRLPTIIELSGRDTVGFATGGIVVTVPGCGEAGGCAASCINPIFGPPRSSYYRSPSPCRDGPLNAWGVYFSGGGVGDDGSKTVYTFVRAVRSGS